MLTPCKANEHWVVVELCDEIRIEAIEIAVWEFFSGVVREVRVSVGGEDEEEDGDEVAGRGHKWKQVGSFIGKNVRGSQTFTLPQPTSFHRFIRLDFPSYFGTEYYCPVSSLKVYGMNQMEAFKWEQKQLSAVAKDKDRTGNREKEAQQQQQQQQEEERRAKERREREKKERDEKDKQEQRERELDELEKLLHEQAGRLVPQLLTEPALFSSIDDTTPAPTNVPPEPTASVSNKDEEDEKQQVSDSPINESLATSSNSVEPSSNSIEPSTSPPSTSSYTRAIPPRSDSSESIYAFIIRRLNALEGNSSLVARYIEEQAKVMRSMLRRVQVGWDEWKGEWEDEDRGKWQQERMRQEDRLGRVLSQQEQQRIAFDAERKAIETQLRVLADQLNYERRRGIAQLIIMVVLILLGAASRSSTINAILTPLLTEARRRKSDYYHKKSLSGPLAGLHIDMGAGRPPAIIGQARAQTHTPRHVLSSSSSTPTPRIKTSLSRAGSGHRPNISSLKRRGIVPQVSIPSSEFALSPRPLPLPLTNGHNQAAPSNPKPSRASFPPPRLPPHPQPPSLSRKLAQSAHLHNLHATDAGDRLPVPVGSDRNRTKTITTTTTTTGTPRRVDSVESVKGITSMNMNMDMGMNTDTNTNMSTRRRRMRSEEERGLGMENVVVAAEDTSQGEWGTDDFDTEAEEASASASEVDDQVGDKRGSETDVKEEHDQFGDTQQQPVREKEGVYQEKNVGPP
ncbi:hypothetical protein C365_02616 [Cryptococcus neoformans Bt85]|nr:hypothetical protein C365_02616 [Cryptococcus neoformans var. grubii Bt85]